MSKMYNNKTKKIDEVKTAFDNWRGGRKNLREPIPESLWQRAVELNNDYPLMQIVETLKLNYAKFKKLIRVYKENTDKKINEKQSFVQLNFTNSQEQFQTKSINFQLERPDGFKLQIDIQSMTNNEMHELIRTFMNKE